MMRAVMAARRGEFGAASTEIQNALDAQPNDPDLLVQAAELQSWTGRAVQAEKLARRAVEIDPDHMEALKFLGDLLLARALATEEDVQGRNEALAIFEKLAALPDADSEALERLVQLRHRSGDLDGAIEMSRRVIELVPGNSAAARTLAQLLLQAEDETGALEVLLRYVASHPLAEDIGLFGEHLAHNLEAWETVVETLGAQTPYPKSAQVAQRLLGEAYLRLGRMDEAARVLERASEGSPEDLRVRNHLALAYRGAGRNADAAILLSEMIDESPEFPSFRQLLAETLEFQGDSAGAIAAYSDALERWRDAEDAAPVRDAIRHRMALLYLGRDEFEAARSSLDEVENADGVLTVRIRGRVAIESEQWDEARRAARRVKALEEDGLAALLEGEILARQGRWGKAEPKFEQAIDELGPELRRRIAEIYRTEDRAEEGRLLLEEWVESSPDNPDARFLYGEYLYLIDRFEDAEPELRAAFELDPEHAAAMNFLGYSYAENDARLEEALELVQRALELDAWNGAYLDSLGWVFHQMGRYDEAREPLERAAREMPQDPTILEHLGDVYTRLGDRDAALAAWERAMAAGPEDPHALQSKMDHARAATDDEAVAEEDLHAEDGADTSSLMSPR
jgi:tetratricopeptide (TPR) repeat protein